MKVRNSLFGTIGLLFFNKFGLFWVFLFTESLFQTSNCTKIPYNSMGYFQFDISMCNNNNHFVFLTWTTYVSINSVAGLRLQIELETMLHSNVFQNVSNNTNKFQIIDQLSPECFFNGPIQSKYAKFCVNEYLWIRLQMITYECTYRTK